MDIEINNKRILRVEIKNKKMYFIHIDEYGNIERADSITEGEIVLLYDYLRIRKDEGKEIL